MKIKLSVFAITLVCLFVIGTGSASAAQTDFTIKANSSYGASSTKNTKWDRNQKAYVNWKGSNKGSHKEWFKVVNSDDDTRSKSELFAYLGAGYITEESCEYSYHYYLKARREHVGNPTTTVSGAWES